MTRAAAGYGPEHTMLQPLIIVSAFVAQLALIVVLVRHFRRGQALDGRLGPEMQEPAIAREAASAMDEIEHLLDAIGSERARGGA
jgi:hypothetical protein